MKGAQIAAIAAVAVGALVLARKANATTAATSVGGAAGAVAGTPASPYGNTGMNGGYSLAATLGASSAGPNVTAGTASTSTSTTASNSGAPQPPGGGYAEVYPESNTVTQAAQGAYIKPEWEADIRTIYQQGGVEALNAAQAQYGIETFNAGQARAIYDLTDADVAYLQGQGILQ